MKIRKAVIPAAGLGTRLLPSTKVLPKEMIPVGNKPIIQYVVEEAVESGIESILIITSRNKRLIEDHFDKSVELESYLEDKNKSILLNQLREISNFANIQYVRQKEPLGLGHAVSCAKSFVGNEFFAVLLGDDIMIDNPHCLTQLINIYAQESKSVIATKKVDYEDVHKYGVISYEQPSLMKNQMLIRDLVEKPIENPPSNFAIMGRYILSPAIFDYLSLIKPGVNGEIQLTDALRGLAKSHGIIGLDYQGKRYDVGDHLGILQANIEIGLNNPILRPKLIKYLSEIKMAQNQN